MHLLLFPPAPRRVGYTRLFYCPAAYLFGNQQKKVKSLSCSIFIFSPGFDLKLFFYNFCHAFLWMLKTKSDGGAR